MLDDFPSMANERQRREMHCGWLEEEDWIFPIVLPHRVVGGRQSMGISGVEYTEDICPGWTVRQPLVEEIAQAYVAFEKGGLASMFPDVADCVAEGVLELSRSFAEFEQRRMAIMDEEAKTRG